MIPPETRPSLLLRIRNPANHTAWEEFTEIYRPVICRLAGIRGMQEADAEDLAQQVLMSIAGAIGDWEVDPERATFRTWLKRVANNAILNALTRGVPDRGSGGADLRHFLEQHPDSNGPESGLLRTEYRREIFLRAARHIRDEFTDETWNSFWLTAVQGMDVEAAARELGRTRGSVYASRSRVMKRLKQRVEKCEDLMP
jgi:RNA polymerase sigma factor (sigma-70 family)